MDGSGYVLVIFLFLSIHVNISPNALCVFVVAMPDSGKEETYGEAKGHHSNECIRIFPGKAAHTPWPYQCCDSAAGGRAVVALLMYAESSGRQWLCVVWGRGGGS